MSNATRSAVPRRLRAAAIAGAIAFTGGLTLSPLAHADNAVAIDQSVKDSLVYVAVEYSGYVQIPAQFGGGRASWSKELKADFSCTGFVVDPQGFIATAGHCVDPSDPDVAQAFHEQLIRHVVDDGDLDADKADGLLSIANHQHWAVEGRDPGSPVARTVEVVQPDGPGRVISTLTTAQVVDFQKFDDGDNALLKVSHVAELKPLVIATSAPPPGTALTSVGFPGSVNETVDQSRLQAPSFKSGTASSQQIKPSGAQSTEINADVSPGMSGGPTIDVNTGQVLGVNSYGIRGETQAFNFITDAAALRAFMVKNGVQLATAPAPAAAHPWWTVAAAAGGVVAILAAAALALVTVRRRARRGTIGAVPHADAVPYPNGTVDPGSDADQSAVRAAGPWPFGIAG